MWPHLKLRVPCGARVGYRLIKGQSPACGAKESPKVYEMILSPLRGFGGQYIPTPPSSSAYGGRDSGGATF